MDTPGSNQNYEFTDNVILTGIGSPPDWVGNIYIYQDGVQMRRRAPRSQLQPLSCTCGLLYSINNIGGTNPLTGPFSFDIGPQRTVSIIFRSSSGAVHIVR